MVLVVSLSPVDLPMVSLVSSHRQPIDDALGPCQCVSCSTLTQLFCATLVEQSFFMNGTLKFAIYVNRH